MPKSLVARIRLLYLPLDLLFSILIPLALINGITPEDTLYALVVLYGVGLGRSVVLNVLFGRMFGPIGRWLQSGQYRPDARDVRAIDAAIRRAPVTLAMWLGTLWFAQLMLGTLLLLYVNPYKAGIAPRALVTAVLMSAATFLGSIPFMVPLMSIFLNDSARKLFEIAHKAGIPLEREPTSLKLKLVWLTASIGLAGPLWMASTSYSADAARAVVEARADCEIEIGRAHV